MKLVLFLEIFFILPLVVYPIWEYFFVFSDPFGSPELLLIHISILLFLSLIITFLLVKFTKVITFLQKNRKYKILSIAILFITILIMNWQTIYFLSLYFIFGIDVFSPMSIP